MSISRGLKFTMVEYLSKKNEIALVTPINKIVSYYKSHVLHVGIIFLDPKFHFLEEKLVSITLNKTGARDHILEVERQI